MSLYADYIKEHRNDEMIEREEGFASYRYIDDNGTPAVYIVDIYVRPDFRETNIASKMADEIITMALRVGCKRLIGTVVPSAKHSTTSLWVLLRYGMKLYNSTNDLIVFKKEI